jgi:hypothetical protein
LNQKPFATISTTGATLTVSDLTPKADPDE